MIGLVFLQKYNYDTFLLLSNKLIRHLRTNFLLPFGFVPLWWTSGGELFVELGEMWRLADREIAGCTQGVHYRYV